jgi:hypothetical protein
MITYLIICVACFVASVLFYLNFNSGLGGALSSFKKRLVYSLAILSFIGFIIFANKAYFSSSIQRDKQIVSELKKEYYELDILISQNISGLEAIQDKQLKVRELIQKIENRKPRELDTYVTIITNILSAFIAFVIAFTFKNKILG